MSIELAELSAKLNRETVALQQEEIRRLESEIATLKRGEFICLRCQLRKNADQETDGGF